jgi:hypothetical protein
MLLAAVVLLPLAGCATAGVKTAESTSIDVSGYRTYDWATPAPVVVANEDRERDAAVLEWTIRDAVDRQLAAKGYRRAAGATPDFQVDFGIRLEEKSTDTFGEYITYRELGGKQEMGSAFVFGYEEGTVRLEATDARSRAVVWSGTGRTVLDDGQDVTKLEDAVAKLLASFPAASASPVDLDAKPARVPLDFDPVRAPTP